MTDEERLNWLEAECDRVERVWAYLVREASSPSVRNAIDTLMKEETHFSNYSNHNAVQIYCDSSWAEPTWGDSELGEGVYLAEDGRRYTFERSLVTCPVCVDDRGSSPAKVDT